MDLFLDTEFAGPALLEVCLLDADGNPLIHTRVCPPSLDYTLTWKISAQIHGIRPRNVRNAPAQESVVHAVIEATRGHRVIAYPAREDARFFPGMSTACAAETFRVRHGLRNIVKLRKALEMQGIGWNFGMAHTAMADALACRGLWRSLQAAETTNPTEESARDCAPG